MSAFLLTAFLPPLHHVASDPVDTAPQVFTKELKAGHHLHAGAPGITQLCFETEQTF